jgi:hypothetical protein
VTRRILGPKRKEVAGGWRRLHNEMGHEARMGEIKMHTEFWSENLKGGDHAEDLAVDGKMDLREI